MKSYVEQGNHKTCSNIRETGKRDRRQCGRGGGGGTPAAAAAAAACVQSKCDLGAVHHLLEY
jgi:hypothetical protein